MTGTVPNDEPNLPRGNAKPKKFRAQISLFGLCLLITLVAVGLGFWVRAVDPVLSQWKAAEAILAMGGSFETSRSFVPLWTKRFIPGGHTENIVAVKFNYQTASDEAIDALRHLPHLRRLYVEKSNLQDHHVKKIAKLKHVERLAIWGCPNLTDSVAAELIAMPKIKLIDTHDNSSMTWRSLLPFQQRPDIKLIESFGYDEATANELETLASLNNDSVKLKIRSPLPDTAQLATKLFPKLNQLEFDRWDTFDESTFSFLRSLIESKTILITCGDGSHGDNDPWILVRESFGEAFGKVQIESQNNSMGIGMSVQRVTARVDSLHLPYKSSRITFKSKSNVLTELGENWLSKMEFVSIAGNDRVVDLAMLDKSFDLKQLRMTRCPNLDSLNGLQRKSNLESLVISGSPKCDFNKTILGDLSGLTYLKVDGSELSTLDAVHSLSILKALELYNCSALTSFEGSESLAKLKSLTFRKCPLLRLNQLGECANLERLAFLNCDSFNDLSALDGLDSLKSLFISNCDLIESTAPLPILKQLETLTFDSCESLGDLDGLSELPNLKVLFVTYCDVFKSTIGIRGNPALEKLSIHYCPNLASLNGIENLERLATLNLTHSSLITSTKELRRLPNLETLRLSQCESLTDVDGLSRSPKLKDIDLSGCKALISLDGIRGLAKLQRLDLKYCQALSSLSGLTGNRSLKELILSNCNSLVNFDGLGDLPEIEELSLTSCTTLSDLDGLKSLASLRSLHITYNTALSDLTTLVELKNLTKLQIAHLLRTHKPQGN